MADERKLLRVIFKKEKLLRAFTGKNNDSIFQSDLRESFAVFVEGESLEGCEIGQRGKFDFGFKLNQT